MLEQIYNNNNFNRPPYPGAPDNYRKRKYHKKSIASTERSLERKKKRAIEFDGLIKPGFYLTGIKSRIIKSEIFSNKSS